MHMNSAPHLLAEDRPEFERVLDLALRSADRDPEISALIAAEGRRLDIEQLRTSAVRAMAAISASALPEYRNYVRAREELRRPHQRSAAVGSRGRARQEGDTSDGPGTSGTSASGADASGAGAGAVLTVLAPVLAGIAAFLFLLIGYVLKAMGTESSVARPMVTAGWWFAGLTATGALIAMGALLLTALRNGRPGAPGTVTSAAGPSRVPRVELEADRARDAWHEALLHRGVLPFLRRALADAPVAPDSSYVPGPREERGRTSRLGFSSPGFSSHEEQPGPHLRPRFTSPDYTGPEFGGSNGRE
ncbi:MULTISPECIES: hypothetical protein [Streptomyces]|uniref:hypothetical protein n=1 Tax=Streptomyces TaxID=1883 RepID=UPI00163C27E6|nr:MULTISPECIES: hypothetical protein [Streptomyces]MBC2873764.1 hypothetical protein [Streptomyces sp. TYQ1024]UBI37812.1 hypothetical protein K7I03_15935 [Streptomyces mobaraensis]UKW30399.1 hypothetical protein MCU78_15900 [Streptomyces sp. TYQ1024]